MTEIIPIERRLQLALHCLAIEKRKATPDVLKEILEKDPDMKRELQLIDSEPDVGLFAISEEMIERLEKRSKNRQG